MVPESPIDAAIVDSIYDAHTDFLTEITEFLLVDGNYKEGDKVEFACLLHLNISTVFL